MSKTNVCLLIAFLLMAFAAPAVQGQKIQLVEQYALSKNRAKTLEQLVPGSQEYYYFHALEYLNTGRLDDAEALLKNWAKRYGNNGQVKMIQKRLAFLRYDQDPKATLEFIRKELGLNLNHQREIPVAERGLASALDQNLLQTSRLLKSHFAGRNDVDQLEDSALELIAFENMNRYQRRSLLERLRYPDFPNLVNLVIADLNERDSKGFGAYTIHRQLTLEQLKDCVEKMPKLRSNNNYVDTYLRKLQPSNDVNWRTEPAIHRAYLNRLWAFVQDLDPKFNSLKACVLFRRLELDRQEKKYDKQLFTRYLQLPRQVVYINQNLIKRLSSRDHLVNLNANYREQIEIVPIGNDQDLVNEYLHHFLKDANNENEFRPYIETNYLKREFATTKILNGLGDPERWASLLSPEQYKQLVSRVDLEFDSTNSEFYDVDENVQLKLHCKNVNKLIVKIFEINTFNYYRKHRREIDTDINLDGLVPNFEQTFEYEDAPALRLERSFEFDQLNAPGVYIIDFIGNGKSSRALIRKGRLSVISSLNVAGHGFRVIDQESTPVTDAKLWISGRQYEPAENGVIVVPYSTSPGRTPMIIKRGDFSCLEWFQHQAEQYHLKAAIVVDRESLVRSHKAKVMIRPQLSVSGQPVGVELLEDVKLTVTSTDLEGNSATKQFEDLDLATNAETLVEFVSPPRLKNLLFQLTAKVKNVSQNRQDTLQVNHGIGINEIDQTDEIQDLHLVPHSRGYSVEVLGKTGETRAGQAVRFGFHVRGFKNLVHADLQSDEAGMIHLGRLPNVDQVQATLTGNSTRQWPVNWNRQTYYRTIHAPQGNDIHMPVRLATGDLRRIDASLTEMRHGQYVRDWFDAMSLKENMLVLTGLEPGDYRLRLKEFNQIIDIRIGQGKGVDNVIVGDHRRLETRDATPMNLKSVTASSDQVEIQLENADDWTRVHVIASWYHPRFSAYHWMSDIRDTEPWKMIPAVRRSVYMAGRRIGDEYQYILDRKYAEKYPGNMLTRPSMLINPWMLRETNNQVESLASGSEFGEAGNEPAGSAEQSKSDRQQGAGNADFANLDFLAEGSTLIANLRPDENGRIVIDRELLGDRQHVRVIAAGAHTTAERTANLPLLKKQLRDLRLANVMDAERHFSLSRQVDLLDEGEQFEIADILSAKFQYYDDLDDVFRFLNTINPGKLGDFQFIVTWPDLEDERKRELYSKHACHELNFFLMKKDPEFFDLVVAQHLAHKRNKTFLDRYLLGLDLSQYTLPWQYSRLNVFERILLAQKLEGREADIRRNVNEMYLLQPTPRNQAGTLFDTALVSQNFGNQWGTQRDQLQDKRRNLLPELAAAQPRTTSTADDFDLGRPQQLEGNLGLGGGRGGGAGGRSGYAPGSDRAGGIATRAPSRPDAKRGEVFYADESEEMDADSIRMGVEMKSLAVREKAMSKLSRVEQQQAGKPLGRLREELKRKGDAPPREAGRFVPDTESLGELLEFQTLMDLRKSNKAFYRRLDATREWIESHYRQIPLDKQTPELVQINQFWRDYINHQGGRFLSPNFVEANRTFTEMMMALSVIDLPFKAPEHDFVYADAKMTLKTAGPMIALHQQVQPAVVEAGNTTVLISENFYQKNDRYRHENGVQYDKFITDGFVAHTLYGGQVVVTNPTSTPREIDLLMQIPQGAVFASGSQETNSIQTNLAAFSTQTFDYFFYFPTAGEFTHFPAHVSSEEKVLAVAEPVSFSVEDRPAEIDKSSWAYVSQNGSDDDVIKFLDGANILRLNLDKIAFRMKDKAFFDRAIRALRDRQVYNHTLWSYAVMHNDVQALREFLSNENRMVQNLGMYFDSSLLTVDPIERAWYYHREYWPLVNARTHQLGKQRTILNPEFHRQYHSFMDVLANHSQLQDDDHLIVTYYMLLQDRISDAMDHFSQVNEDNIQAKMQYDYCDAYLDMYRSKPEEAAAKAEKWADYPVLHWRNRFKAILAQVEEIRGGETAVVDDENKSERQTSMASRAESFDFEVEAGKGQLRYQNLEQVAINYYEMDIELLFSRSPFAQDELDGFSMIRPNLTRTVKLEPQPGDEAQSHEFELPAELANKNVLVEVVAGDQAKSKPYFANSLNVQMIETFGQLQVTDKEHARPLPTTYVKVYSRDANGIVKFHKDGYTDLRGRFDYVSQSNNTLDGISKYSILVLHPEYGAIVRQADPPKE